MDKPARRAHARFPSAPSLHTCRRFPVLPQLAGPAEGARLAGDALLRSEARRHVPGVDVHYNEGAQGGPGV
jgi:hypothetical protein